MVCGSLGSQNKLHLRLFRKKLGHHKYTDRKVRKCSLVQVDHVSQVFDVFALIQLLAHFLEQTIFGLTHIWFSVPPFLFQFLLSFPTFVLLPSPVAFSVILVLLLAHSPALGKAAERSLLHASKVLV